MPRGKTVGGKPPKRPIERYEHSYTAKPNANSQRATAFSSRPRRGNYRLLTENSALSNESAVPAISKSGWTRVAKFDSISASIRILTTDTQ